MSVWYACTVYGMHVWCGSDRQVVLSAQPDGPRLGGSLLHSAVWGDLLNSVSCAGQKVSYGHTGAPSRQ